MSVTNRTWLIWCHFFIISSWVIPEKMLTWLNRIIFKQSASTIVINLGEEFASIDAHLRIWVKFQYSVYCKHPIGGTPLLKKVWDIAIDFSFIRWKCGFLKRFFRFLKKSFRIGTKSFRKSFRIGTYTVHSCRKLFSDLCK